MQRIHSPHILHTRNIRYKSLVIRTETDNKVDFRTAVNGLARLDIIAAIKLPEHIIGSDILHITQLPEDQALGQKLSLSLPHGKADKVRHGSLLRRYRIDSKQDTTSGLHMAASLRHLGKHQTAPHLAHIHRISHIDSDTPIRRQIRSVTHTHIGKVRHLDLLTMMSSNLEKKIGHENKSQHHNTGRNHIPHEQLSKNPLKSIFQNKFVQCYTTW